MRARLEGGVVGPSAGGDLVDDLIAFSVDQEGLSHWLAGPLASTEVLRVPREEDRIASNARADDHLVQRISIDARDGRDDERAVRIKASFLGARGQHPGGELGALTGAKGAPALAAGHGRGHCVDLLLEGLEAFGEGE